MPSKEGNHFNNAVTGKNPASVPKEMRASQLHKNQNSLTESLETTNSFYNLLIKEDGSISTQHSNKTPYFHKDYFNNTPGYNSYANVELGKGETGKKRYYVHANTGHSGDLLTLVLCAEHDKNNITEPYETQWQLLKQGDKKAIAFWKQIAQSERQRMQSKERVDYEGSFRVEFYEGNDNKEIIFPSDVTLDGTILKVPDGSIKQQPGGFDISSKENGHFVGTGYSFVKKIMGSNGEMLWENWKK